MANPFQSIIDQTSGGRRSASGLDINRDHIATWRDRQDSAGRRRAARTEELTRQTFGPQGGGGAGSGGGLDVNDSRQQILDATMGYRDQILNDPSQQLALDRMREVLGGEATPFNDEVRNALLSTAADQSANSSANQQASILQNAARQGLSPSDPAVQAQLRAVSGQQAIAGQQASQSLNSQANLANFNARQRAAAQLAQMRLAQMNLGGQFGLAGANFLQNDVQRQNVGPVTQQYGYRNQSNNQPQQQQVYQPQVQPINYSQSQPQSRPSPQPQPQSQPRPQPRITEAGNGGADLSQYAFDPSSYLPGGANDPQRNQTPAYQPIGSYNPYGNTAIPGGY